MPTESEEHTRLATANERLLRVNEALVHSVDRYLAFHDLAPTPMITVDLHGEIMDANDAAVSLFGCSTAALTGHLVTEFVPEASQPILASGLATLFEVGTSKGTELTLMPGPSGHCVSMDAVVLPGTVASRAVLAFFDLTERNIEEQKRQAQLRRQANARRLESLGVLAAGIAHELSNLMTVVLSGAESVLPDLVASSSHRAPLLDVREAAQRAGALANQMLAYSGRTSVPVRAIDLATLLRDGERNFRSAAGTTSLAIELQRHPLLVLGDERQLTQAIENLVVNAAEAMVGRPGAIAITLSAVSVLSSAHLAPRDQLLGAGEYVVVEVSDGGVGMDAATQSRAFEPYFSTKLPGRGLGLAFVDGVARSHGGATDVDSSVETGTTFRLFLRAGDTQPVADPVAPSGWPCHGTILLVDDEEAIRVTISRSLRRLGFSVEIASSGRQALEILASAPLEIDLVVTDLTMPEMNGVDLARALRRIRPQLPIVLVTGYGDIPLDGVDLFSAALAKPFVLEDLRALLVRLLAPPTSAAGPRAAPNR